MNYDERSKFYALNIQAYAVYRKLTGLPYNKNTMYQFNCFLGLPENVSSGNGSYVDYVKSNEACLNKLKWLTGPHAATMYQIWKAQNESR